MKKFYTICTTLGLSAFLNGCGGQPAVSRESVAMQAEAKSAPSECATAEKSSDGAMQTKNVDCTAKELEDVNALDSKITSIDDRYPAPEPPLNALRLKAIGVAAPGLIRFRNAPTIRIDGIRCPQDGIERLSKKILAADAEVVISPDEPVVHGPLPAVVWLTYVKSAKEPAASEMFSSIADAALMNNWCEAEYSSTSKYNERYAALAQAFGANKK